MNAIQLQTTPDLAADLVLAGNCGYTIQNDRVIIDIAEIANRRQLGDLSGTLAIELRALKQSQTAGPLEGQVLASTTIGEIAGQHFLADCRYDLIFQEPSQGSWQIVLALREWTGAGYVTRDQICFPVPYVVAGKPAIVRGETDNVISVNFAAPKEAETKTVPSAAVSTPNQAQAKAAVSLNEASVDDIEAVKGVSKKLAENIVATRPFSSFDEVLKVKGMGAKLLQKIRDYITL